MADPTGRGRRRARPDGEHVGVHLHESLEARGVSVYRLAAATGVGQADLGQIISGRRVMTPRVALLVGRALSTGPEFWLRLQEHYALKALAAELAPEISAVEVLPMPEKEIPALTVLEGGGVIVAD